MFGVILTSIGTFFEEVAVSIGKIQVTKMKESLYLMGFLNLFWGTVILATTAIIIPSSFSFSYASLPTFIPRLLLEILQAHISLLAIIKAHRSSFGFIRIITIPLILLVDIFLGYSIGTTHIIGMGLIFITLIFLFLNQRIKKVGLGLVIFTAVNAVITISLYKYNITHFNSVVAEQGIIHLALLLYFMFGAWHISKEHPFRMLGKKIFFFQSFASGLGGVVMSFAYMFDPASVIVATRRALAILWTIIAGNRVFHEHHLIIKLAAFIMLVIGIIMLV